MAAIVASDKVKIHPTAEVSPKAEIGGGSQVWNFAIILPGARIGRNCIIAKNVFIDHDVVVGNTVKIQNNVSVYFGVTLEDFVFVGPHACFTNDMRPRAAKPDGSLKGANDWKVSKTLVKKGASIGANATVLPVVIGQYAFIAAGSVVTKDVPDFALVRGNPARVAGYVCKCCEKFEEVHEHPGKVSMYCSKCDTRIEVPRQGK